MNNEHSVDCDGECEDWQDEPACKKAEHKWTSEGMGGCDSNPGVWSLGGTTHQFRSQCVHCGKIRTEIHYGSQRNPGQCDQRRFEDSFVKFGDDDL